MSNHQPGETDSFILKLNSITEPLPVTTLFPSSNPLEVELGAGDGSFLVNYAAAHPQRNFLGVERLLGRIRKIDRKSKRLALQNVRLVRIEASYFARFLLPRESVDAFHIYFPDPWPKRRHWKNRLIAPEFVEVLRSALRPGGQVFLRTDNRPYFEQMLESFAGNAAFQKIETPLGLLQFVTDFERNFHAAGVPTLESSYRRIV